MKSKIDAVNQGLIFIGQNPINALDEGSVNAGKASLLIDQAMDEVLRAHPWNFAIKRVRLTPLATTPPFDYAYKFQRPSDWIRTLSTSTLEFVREGDAFLANVPTLDLIYVFRETDLTRWDALAAAALARNVASKLAYNITGSSTVQDAQWQMYAALLRQAQTIDAQEQPAGDFEESSLISARRR